ncbi:MAG: sel1 repeat family protein [Bdellovibrionales bacterium]|nr:sel1 repeat family protein [Bdellovibrionales bacterium]
MHKIVQLYLGLDLRRQRYVVGGLFSVSVTIGWSLAFCLDWMWNKNFSHEIPDIPLRQAAAPDSPLRRSPASIPRGKVQMVTGGVDKILAGTVEPGKVEQVKSMEIAYWQVVSRWADQLLDSQLALDAKRECQLNFQSDFCFNSREKVLREIRQNLKGAQATLFECELGDAYFRSGSKVMSCARAAPGSEANYSREVVVILERACQDGDESSCFALGHRYFLQHKDQLARHYFHRGCKGGDTKNCFALAELYRWQGETEKSLPILRTLCRTSDKWRGWTCFSLAAAEMDLGKNRPMALQALRMSCNNHEPAGCYQLATMMAQERPTQDLDVLRILTQGCFRQQGLYGFNPLPCWSLMEWRKVHFEGAGVGQVVKFMLDSGGYRNPDTQDLADAKGNRSLAPMVSMLKQDMRMRRLYSCGRAYYALVAFGTGVEAYSQNYNWCRAQVEIELDNQYEFRDMGIFRKYYLYQ